MEENGILSGLFLRSIVVRISFEKKSETINKSVIIRLTNYCPFSALLIYDYLDIKSFIQSKHFYPFDTNIISAERKQDTQMDSFLCVSCLSILKKSYGFIIASMATFCPIGLTLPVLYAVPFTVNLPLKFILYSGDVLPGTTVQPPHLRVIAES